MRTIVSALLILLGILSISGCSAKEIEERIIYIPTSCIIEEPELPKIEQIDSNSSYIDIVHTALQNYIEQRSYAKKLKEAFRACR